ncbi:helix-turn-helix transcriptional regulator [Lysinibacillus capsici]|uniref:helix-turn-helix transcriptional regulator n=1 Tax=Lysinibacillus capsici TaxID=2115968 RepID=UPI003F22F6DD
MRYWLKILREKKGMTQEEVAKLVGISRSAYGHIESGERGVTVKNANKIAMILEFNWILFFEKLFFEMKNIRVEGIVHI